MHGGGVGECEPLIGFAVASDSRGGWGAPGISLGLGLGNSGANQEGSLLGFPGGWLPLRWPMWGMATWRLPLNSNSCSGCEQACQSWSAAVLAGLTAWNGENQSLKNTVVELLLAV